MKLLNKRTVSIATGAATAATFLSVPVRAQVDRGLSATEPAASQAGGTDINSVISAAINILLFIVGVASVIMLIVGGIRYIVSSGDQQAVAGAKNTIIYAIVGIVVAVLAFAAVNFVFNTLQSG